MKWLVCSCIYLCRWLLSSEVIQEVDLGGNWIGDAGGRELLAALNERKEGIVTMSLQIAVLSVCLLARLPAVRLTVTHRMSSDIFASIVELGRAGKKKGGKKRGKRKVSSSIHFQWDLTTFISYISSRRNKTLHNSSTFCGRG